MRLAEETARSHQAPGDEEVVEKPQGGVVLKEANILDDVEDELTSGGTVIEVIYSSGTSAQASNTGTISGVTAGIKYHVKVEVLRNDLGSDSERVSAIQFDGTSMGDCNPDGGDYDCTMYDCASTLSSMYYTPTASTIAVVLTFTGHSHDCDCDLETWECSKENTVSGRTAMTAVARVTLTPLETGSNAECVADSTAEKIQAAQDMLTSAFNVHGAHTLNYDLDYIKGTVLGSSSSCRPTYASTWEGASSYDMGCWIKRGWTAIEGQSTWLLVTFIKVMCPVSPGLACGEWQTRKQSARWFQFPGASYSTMKGCFNNYDCSACSVLQESVEEVSGDVPQQFPGVTNGFGLA